MKNALVVWLALLGSSSSVPAAAEEYYVVRNFSTKQCTVVESAPTTTELVIIKDGAVYFELNEAELALASVPDCTSPPASKAASGSKKNMPSQQTEARRNNAATQSATGTPAAPKIKTAVQKLPGQTVAASQHSVEQNPISSFFSLFR